MSHIGRLALLSIPVYAVALFGSAVAGALQPSTPQEAIASAVGLTMQHAHYSRQEVDDALSERWFDLYLDNLDYSRLLFTEEDIASFSQWRDALDDDILRDQPTLEAAYAIFDRYAERYKQRWEYSLSLLDEAPTFDDPEWTVSLNLHENGWAKDEAELQARWKAQVANLYLNMTLAAEVSDNEEEEATSGFTMKPPLERLKKRFERNMKDAEDIDVNDVLEIYLGAFSNSFDPHSLWWKPASKEDFDIQMSDSLTGIGARLRSIDGYTTIDELIPGGPAEKSGLLHPKDQILAVRQTDGEAVDIVDMRLDRVVQLIRGPVDTDVILTIHPGDVADPAVTKEITLTRAKVQLEANRAKGEVFELPGNTPEESFSVALIDVPSFYIDYDAMSRGVRDYNSTANDMRRILTEYNEQGVDAVVIDLRTNGGGALSQAEELTGLFLEGGPVVQIRSRDGQIEVLKDRDKESVWTKPVVVLTSELSASASEIFAAAIQDYGRGLIVGSETTHGKGTVQNMMGLDRMIRSRQPDMDIARRSAVKFTTHMFYRINGESTQVRGVAADVVIPSPYSGMDVLESDLDYPLPWARIASATYTPTKTWWNLGDLKSKSAERIESNVEFGYLLDDLKERAEMEERNTLSLDPATRKAEQADFIARDDAREAARKAAGWDGETVIDPIRDEALAITADLLQQQASLTTSTSGKERKKKGSGRSGGGDGSSSLP